jgi:hypothetical protein
MRTFRAHLLIPALLLGLSGCDSAYDPHVQGDHTADQYKTDLDKCTTTSTEAVRIRNADNPWSWMMSPFRGPPAVRAAIRTCMAGNGYVAENTGN